MRLENTRKGMTSIDVIAVICLITVASVTVLYSVGSSTSQSFKGLASELSPRASHDNSNPRDHVLATSTNSTYTIHRSPLILAAGAVCVLLLVTPYLRHVRRREKELNLREEETQRLQQQSIALQKLLSKRNSIYQRVDEDIASIVRGHALVGTYMSTSLVSIGPEVEKMDALARMKQQGYRRFMVKHANGDMAGVVSKQDILSKEGTLVKDVMTANPKITTPETEIHSALSVLLENRISCLPVVKDGKLVGLLSVSDLLMVLQCILRDLRERSEDHSHH